MCLHTLDFTLKWNNKEQAFIGKGYKSAYSPSLGKWQKAHGSFYSNHDLLKISKEYADIKNKAYVPGFHIFLKPEHALEYGGDKLIEVMFKNPLGFGTNHSRKGFYRPCVLSEYMKVTKIFTNDEVKKYQKRMWK